VKPRVKNAILLRDRQTDTSTTAHYYTSILMGHVCHLLAKELAEKTAVSTTGLLSKLLDKRFINQYCFIGVACKEICQGK